MSGRIYSIKQLVVDWVKLKWWDYMVQEMNCREKSWPDNGLDACAKAKHLSSSNTEIIANAKQLKMQWETIDHCEGKAT